MSSSSGAGELEVVRQIKELKADLKRLPPGDPERLPVQQQLAALMEKELLLMRAAGGSELAPDCTGAQSLSLLQVGEGQEPPSDPASLLAFLSQPCLFPMDKHLLATLRHRVGESPRAQQLLAANMVACESAYGLSAYLRTVLLLPSPVGGCSEASAIATLAPLLELYLENMSLWSGDLPGLDHDRDKKDLSGLTRGDLRPDLMVWLMNKIMILKAEHKSDQYHIMVPMAELGDKMVPVWSTLTHGSMPYLVCLASAGTQVQLAYIARDTTVAIPLGAQLDVTKVDHRLALLIAVTNVARLAKIMCHRHPPPHLCLNAVLRCPLHGSSVTILADCVLKQVTHFTTRPNCGDFETLKKMYAGIKNTRGLIQARTPPTLSEHGTYSVFLEPLGFQDSPRTEAVLRTALQQALVGLARLHLLGYVHRDVRPPNMLSDGQGQYFFSDLEGAGLIEGEAQQGCKALDSLLFDGRYTAASDLKMLASFFVNVGILTAHGDELRAALEAGTLADATEALAHPWFQTG